MWYNNVYFMTVSSAFIVVSIFFFFWKRAHRKDKQPTAKRFRIKIIIGSVFCTLLVAALQESNFQSILLSALVSIMITAAFGGLEKLIDIQSQAEEARKLAVDIKGQLAESQLEPGRVQGLFDQINNLGKKVDESSAQIRQASDRDANVTRLLEGLNTSLEVVNDIKNACLETQSQPLIYIANNFVQNFFGDRFKIEGTYQAVINGRQTSIDAYKALWEFLLDEQDKRGRSNSIVIRALHSAPLQMWRTDTETGEGRRAQMLLNLHRKFIESGGRVYRIVVNRLSPDSKNFTEFKYRDILAKMQGFGIDVAYLYHNNKHAKSDFPYFPRTGFIWAADFEYGQGWHYHRPTSTSTIVTKTKILWGKRHRDYAYRWQQWKILVDNMREANDSRLIFMADSDLRIYN